jgi:hypothetical protein
MSPFPRPLLRAAMLSAAVLAVSASAAAANPPGSIECPAGQIPVNNQCVDAGDPPPQGPTVKLELAQQNTDRAGTHVVGYATATDTSKAMSVQYKIDGVVKTSGTANVSRSDVGAHGFDLTVPSGRDASQVCVIATDPQNHGTTTLCKGIDGIKQFDATSITYDTAHDVIEEQDAPDELDTVTNTNGTEVRQKTTISGSETLTDTASWSDTQHLVVHAEGAFSIPVVGDLGVEVTNTSTFVQNGSTESVNQFAWEQPVVVPAMSEVVAHVVVTRSTLTVPYSLKGSFEYDSGAKVRGTLDGGTYHGVNSHNLHTDLEQFDLDGNPVTNPVVQPKPLLVQPKPVPVQPVI